ncbi:MAG: Pyruvate synthase subunit PorC [Candidatus Moranbacteria bacterium GW2011_GWF2_36_839]|nr:MAG: Pyruvate synthase subunit PorC [Candidatus Moranbacteria bacterium GW2011_GWF1_36_78]KKQ17018.1 MAG: Pyruvate synthase subunit PorC [Candidatus Moranbacteria bacterium GW2011_GWF2_36_839]HAT74030.1 pyruvate synthase [Candidatus Moranbacteria bacterium]HBY11194.1 pyruvate synthase [Candidatus Moranbacteria bacterium]
MKNHKDIFEVIFFARGGQGAKTTAEILAQAGTHEDKFVQAFPSFGPERSGAPTKTYLRISDHEIRTHEPVVDPDLVVVLDDTLLDSQEVAFNLDKDEFLIINTKMAEHEVREKLIQKGGKFEGKIHPIDASGISLSIIGQPRPNTVILGKFVQVSGIIKMESIIEEFRRIFEKKLGKENCDKNIQAIEKAYDTI